MIRTSNRNGWVFVAALAVLACFAVIVSAQSPFTAPYVLYTAAGTFASPAVSGNDVFKLAGEPFNITVLANTATAPHAHGTGWADYTGLHLRGTVHSGLLPSGVPLTSANAFLALGLGNPNYQIFQMQAPVIAIKDKIIVSANIQMPLGTLGKGWRIYPFNAAVALSPANATVTYTNGTASTVLQIATGTLTAAYPTPPAR